MERPILFSAPMIQSILAGRKTMTRRIVKDKQLQGFDVAVGLGECLPLDAGHPNDQSYFRLFCPYGEIGDRLWVKETWQPKIAHSCTVDACDCGDVAVTYIADSQTIFFADRNIDSEWLMPKAAQNGKNVSSLFMPRWASRILLEITDVRVERLQDISEEDALAEGIISDHVIVGAHCAGGRHTEKWATRYFYDGGDEEGYECAVDAYAALWESINGAGSWAANPWVWVVSFRVVQGGDL